MNATAAFGLGEPGKRSAFTRFAYACQFFYGGWFLFHGLNYWFEFYFDRSIQPGPGLVPALAESGVMAVVKVLEVVIGLALLADLAVPLAVIAAWPITLMIAYVNSSHLSLFGTSVGAIIIVLNAVMSLGHLDRYRPMLALRAGPPTLDGLSGMGRPSARDRSRLPALPHVLAAIAGLAAAVGVTFLTLYLRH